MLDLWIERDLDGLLGRRDYNIAGNKRSDIPLTGWRAVLWIYLTLTIYFL
jgi:hypothetical protein